MRWYWQSGLIGRRVSSPPGSLGADPILKHLHMR